MNIIREDIDELNALLKVKVEEKDYLPKVESALKEYQKKGKIDGFRPGKMPMSLIKKKYGISMKAEEINNIIVDSLNKYQEENGGDIIGNPIRSKYRTEEIDWHNQKDFEFLYDIGLVPKFEVELSPNQTMVYKKIKIKDEYIDEQIKSIASRYGKVISSEISTDKDIVNGDFVELDINGEPLEGGITSSGSLFLPRIDDETTKKSLTGVKVGDKVMVDSQTLSSNKVDLAAMLNIEKEVAENLTSKFLFTVKTITSMVPAELNQEFFNKILGEGAVTNETEFRAIIKANTEKSFEADSDQQFYNDVMSHFMNTLNFSLPTEFLKRWMILAGDEENKMNAEKLEKEFDSYMQDYRWELIESKILKDNNIVVETDEIISFAQQLVLDQLRGYSDKITEEEFDKYVKEIVSDQKQMKRIRQAIRVNKMKALFKSKFTLQIEEVDSDDFFNVKN